MTVLAGGAALAVVAAVLALRPRLLDRLPPQAVWAVAALAALGLATGDAAPTGWVPLDLLARAGVGAAVVLAASRLRTPWTLWLALVGAAAIVLATAGGWEPVAAAGIGVALASLTTGVRSPILHAVAAGAIVASLGHLEWPLATGAPSLLAAVAVIPVLLAGVRVAPPRVRSATAWALSMAVLLVFVGSIVGGLSALAAASDVENAIDAAVDGLDQLDAEDPGPAITKLREAAASFDAAEQTLRTWWARPALLVPGVAQHSRAVATMADAGQELAQAAADSLEQVDLDVLQPIAGRIDPAAIDDVEPALDQALASLRHADERLADVRSPILVPLVADRLDDLAEHVGDAREAAETASAALDVAPDLLGVDAPRRYFLVMHTPSELRGIGGFMGSWGELVIDDGRFELARTGRVTELTQGGADPAGRRIEGHPEFVDHWGQGPAQFWGLIGFSPDFPTVASIITELYPQSGGGELDGVIALDPAGFAALLELTGPITVEGYPQRLTPENAEQILLHDQYLSGEEADREAFLEAAIQTLFEALTAGELPGPRVISEALAPMVDGRHVQLYSTHDAAQQFFQSIEADGSVQRSAPDGVGVISQNYGGNKIDYFLRRSLTYDVSWDPKTGRIDGTVEVQLENLAPASGLPHSVIGWGGDLSANQLPVSDGENLMYVSLYAAAPLSEITVDGEPAELNRVVDDLGYRAYDLYVRVPPGGTRVLRARVQGRIEPGEEYVLEVLRQATATPDQITARVQVPEGWTVDGRQASVDGRTATVRGDAAAPFEVRLDAEPVERTLLERLQGR